MQWNIEQHLPGRSLWSNTDWKKEPGAAPPSHCSKVLLLCSLRNSSPLAEVAFAEVSLMEPGIPPMYFSSGKGCSRVCWGIHIHTCYRGGWNTLTFSCHGLKSFVFNKSVGKITCYIFLNWPKMQLTSVSPRAELRTSFAVSLTFIPDWVVKHM